MSKPIYKRILVKISGEALKNGCETDILDFDFVDKVVASIDKCLKVCYTVAKHNACMRSARVKARLPAPLYAV